MDNRQLTHRLLEFKAKIREEASKVLRNWDCEGHRIVEKRWTETRRNLPLWSDIADNYWDTKDARKVSDRGVRA